MSPGALPSGGLVPPALGAGPSPGDLDALDARFAPRAARDVLAWSLARFGPRLAVASSLGLEDVVLVDLLASLRSETGVEARIFLLDTGRLHQETYDLLDQLRERYGIAPEVYSPQTVAVEALVRAKGPNSFYRSLDDRKECCGVRKVEPLSRALSGADAWVTGMRRAQATTRASLLRFERDGARVKISPLADWSEAETWAYVREHRVPYNALHDRGFPSIGCAPCTRAVAAGDDVRSGRWWWESSEHRECGLHDRPRSGGPAAMG